MFTTVGLLCAADERRLSACSHGDDTETDRRGAFAYKLKGKDTHGFLGNAATLELAATLPRAANELAGPTTVLRFQVQTTSLAFPLRFWETDLREASEGRIAVLSWSAPGSNAAPAEIPLSSLRPTLAFDAAGGQRQWSVAPNGAQARLDVRVLEDATGSVSVTSAGRAMRVPDRLGREVDLILRSPQRPYNGPAGPPPSRGAACSYSIQHGPPAAQAPCPITDGDLAQAIERVPCVGSSPCASTVPTSAVIDLGVSRPAALVVVRGCPGCSVDLSTDGASWRTVAKGASGVSDFIVAPPGAPKARYLRVKDSESGWIVREVSVWDDRAVTTGPILGSAPEPAPPLRRAVERASESAPTLIAMLGVVLVAGLLGGYVLRRRAS